MRNPRILSARPPASPARAAMAPQSDFCRPEMVIRVVLAAELLAAVAVAFVAESATDALMRFATATGGVMPATLLWLIAACALRRRLGRWRPVAQHLAAAIAGVLAGLYGCAVLQGTGAITQAPWLAGAWAGGLFGAAAMAVMNLRTAAQMPAAATARLTELQQRIRPHFLFNTLNSAIALVRDDPARAEAMLEDLAELFRQALAEPGESASLAEEIDLAQRYLAIEQVRFGPRLRIAWQLDEAAAGARLPPLLLQPLVENAVRHGVEPSPEGGELRIRTERRGSRAVIEVVNTLPPLRWAESPLPRGHGIALDNVRSRLRLLHDLQASLSAGLDRDCWRVRIDIPADPTDKPKRTQP
ncbi:MAG: histidine kinase [Pseudacidovorax sp.]|nr:histidine kinase [Pseudacidovorax sp.]